MSIFPTPSGDPYVDALINFDTVLWDGEIPNGDNMVSYAFMDEPIYDSHLGTPVTNFEPLSPEQQSAVRTAMDYTTSVTDLSFVETSPDAENVDVYWGQMDVPSYSDVSAIHYFNAVFARNQEGQFTFMDRFDFIYLDNNEFDAEFDNPQPGTFGYEIILHEIGHVLNLGDVTVTGGLPEDLDNTNYTVMSYIVGEESPQTGFQELDFEALDHLY